VTITSYHADLHLHTCLSPCGDIDMSPKAIVSKALEKKLDIIAVTDHNTVGNVQAVMDAAKDTALTVLAGMEITSKEEVHILAIFPTLELAKCVQDQIFPTIPDSDSEDYIEEQILVNGEDEVEGFCSKLLLSATDFSIKKLVNMIHESKGLAIAAHIDRQAFGIIGQLGFIPPRIKFDALEISWRESLFAAGEKYSDYSNFTFITSSDAHYIEDIGKIHTVFKLAEPSFPELATALAGTVECKKGCIS